MLIDHEKIKAAKEKLGDRNFDYIMEFLGIEDFDAARQRCCCPLHQEDTPSFIYNPKELNCHCFGCNANVDILDAYMKGRNASFVEAVQKLFEITGTTYSFGEVGVKTKRQYKYPHEEKCENKDKVYEYLAKRKISKETADYLDIRQDQHGNIVFNYYDLNDVLVMVKYRPARIVKKGENKNWCQPGADTSPLLYNMCRINPSQPLVIASGELDCASLIEAGIQNAVSIPLGDGNLAWIEECWDFLEQFKEIIIVPDNDPSGIKYCKNVVPRLGSWRCKVASCPSFYEDPEGKKHNIKDINETLYWMGKEAVVDMIANAADSPIPSLIDFSDIEEKDLSNIDGVNTGLIDLDRELMRLFYGSFNILSGTPGSGKTSWLYQLVCNATDNDIGVWLFSRELPDHMTKNWIDFLFAGPRNVNEYEASNGSKYYRVKPTAIKLMNERYRGLLHLYRDECSNAVEDIQTSMIDSARKYGSKLFIIDNLMTVDLHANDNNKWDKQTEFVNWLISFSAKFDVCVVLVCHPKKLQLGQADMDMYDVAGTSNLLNLAHRGFALRRIPKKEKAGIPNKSGNGWATPPYPFDVKLTIMKDRFRGRIGYELGMYYDMKSRRFFTSPQEYDHQYTWDTTQYTDQIEYPVANDAEVYGEIQKE